MWEVDFFRQKRVRVFHQGFKTWESWWKHEVASQVLLLFLSLESLMKHDARVFEIPSQSRLGNKINWKFHKLFVCRQVSFFLHSLCTDGLTTSCWQAKSADGGAKLVESAVPKSTDFVTEITPQDSNHVPRESRPTMQGRSKNFTPG